MKPIKAIEIFLTLVITIPIWYYLIYTILVAIHPDRLVWFLYWIYFPVGILVRILAEIAGRGK